MSQKYKAAIAGCGRIASLFANDKKRKGVVTHAQAYQAHPKTELAAACDLNPERLAQFGRRWGVKSLYTDLNEMLQKEKPDFLSICTWNATHAPIAEAAVSAGVRGIICEKPIAESIASAQRMIDVCRKKRVPLLMNYSRRYNRLHRDIRRQIEKGVLGEIQNVSCFYTAGVMNTGTHLFDILRCFFGDVAWVWSSPGKVLEAPDPTFDIYLHFKKGFGCTISALEVKDYMQFEIDIYGTKGRLRLEDSGMKARFWNVKDHAVYSGYKTLGTGKTMTTDFSDNLTNMVDNLVASAERREKPSCSGEDGLKSLEIALAAHVSLKTGKRVALPLKQTKMKLVSK